MAEKHCPVCGFGVVYIPGFTAKCQMCGGKFHPSRLVDVKKKSNLINCPDCDRQVSKSAQACPGCGAPITDEVLSSAKAAENKEPKKQIGLWSILGYIFIFGLLVSSVGGLDKSAPRKAAPKSRAEVIKNQFSAWDGSHPAVVRDIKHFMNDPDSYEHEKTIYWDKGDHLIVQTSFRGKNALGGVVLQVVKARVDLKGNLLNVLEIN